MQISATLQSQFANAFDVEIGGTGHCRFYTGTVGTPGTKIATCPMNTESFGADSTGLITMATVTAVEDASPVAGTAALMTIHKDTTAAAGAYVVAFGVATDSNADVTMSNPVVATTDTVQVSSLTIQVPTGAPVFS